MQRGFCDIGQFSGTEELVEMGQGKVSDEPRSGWIGGLVPWLAERVFSGCGVGRGGIWLLG